MPLHWPVMEVNPTSIGLGAMSSREAKQSGTEWHHRSPEGITAVLQTCYSWSINLWGRDFLQQMNSEICIPTSNAAWSSQNGKPKGKRIRKSFRGSLNLYSHKDRIVNIDWVFLAGGGFTENIPPLKITRKSSEPLWSPQWFLSKEKSKALHQLVGQQLENGHIGPPLLPFL